MRKEYVLAWQILGWLIMSSFYIAGSFYVLINLAGEESKLFLCLLIWMCISGVMILKTIYNIARDFDAEVEADQ